MELGSTSFVAPYYHGLLALRGGLAAPEALQEAIKSFEKATQINPQFAPAFEGLAQAYSASPETRKPALEAGIRAVKLEPTAPAYAINLIYLLLNADRDADARQLAQKLLEKASSPQESQTAGELLERVKEHEQWVAQRKTQGDAAANPTGQTAVANAPRDTQTMTASSKPIPLDTLMAVGGIIPRVDCWSKPPTTRKLKWGDPRLSFFPAGF